jgi:DNA-binding MarR family transcriptional regulator
MVKEKNKIVSHTGTRKDISESQLRYLKEIDKLRLPTLSELTKEMGYSKASVSISIKKLEQKGLIKKRQSGTDKRSYFLIITGKGVHCVQSQKNVFNDYIIYIKKHLSDQEQTQLGIILEKIIPSP